MFKRSIAGLCALALMGSIPTPSNADSIAIQITPTSARERQLLGQRFDHYIRDQKSGAMVFEASQEDWDWLRRFGFQPTLDSVRTAELMLREADLAKSIPGYACYPTVAETYALIDQLVATYPALASNIDIGDSWEKTDPGGNAGFDMRVLRITNSAIVEDKPKFFAMSAVHAREFATAPLNTAFARWLLEGYGTDANATWLVDHNEFHLLLQSNPDGRLYAEAGGANLNQRKNRHYQGIGTETQIGVDLNRNYPFGWGAFVGSTSSPTGETYRGLSVGSEPENQAVVNYINGIFPGRRPTPIVCAPMNCNSSLFTTPAASDTRGLFFDIHSVANLVLYPWGMTSGVTAGNNTQLRTLARRLAWFNGYSPEQSNSLPADGASDDNAYATLGVPAFTVELGGGSFQANCATFEASILPDNLAMLKYASRTLHAPYLLPAGPDARELIVTPNLAFPGESIQVQAVIDDSRFNNNNGTQPPQNISAASAYFRNVPWLASAVAMPLAAVDGTFNQTTESVGATLSTTGLSIGKHLLFVQGSNAAGVGTPNAVYFQLADPASVGTLSGLVRDGITLQPLQAALTVDTDALTSAANGSFSYRSLPGNVSVLARKPGYLDETLSNVPLLAGQSTLRDIDMLPTCNAFIDDAESGNLGWTAQGTWAIQSGVGINGATTQFWSDSPSGNYANNTNVSLTSPIRNFTALDGVRLEFDHRCVTEANYDYGHVEYSTNGGTSWSTYAFRCSGDNGWKHESVPLSALDNQSNARVRFRLTSDSSQVRDGWWIDNIRLESAGPACRATQANALGIFGNGFE